MFLIRHMLMMADSLCARLAVQPPWRMLRPAHNGGHRVDRTYWWDRYLKVPERLLSTERVEQGRLPDLTTIGPTELPTQIMHDHEKAVAVTAGSSAGSQAADCRDTGSWCGWWRETGSCERGFMREHCKLTCGLCAASQARVAESCEDRGPWCKTKRDSCGQSFMQERCRVTCGLCSPLLSLPQRRNSSFWWEIRSNFYEWQHSERDVLMPPVCPVTLWGVATAVHEAAQRAKAALGVVDGSLYTLHIRRGDTKSKCNTSVPAVVEYMKCPKARWNEPHDDVLVLLTDETDPAFIEDATNELSKLPRWGGGVKHGDPVIAAQLPEDDRSDNFLVYAVVGLLRSAAAYPFEMHRCDGMAPCPSREFADERDRLFEWARRWREQARVRRERERVRYFGVGSAARTRDTPGTRQRV